MTRPDHYREAERLLELAANSKETTYEGANPEADRDIAAAQAHATLALAAATAMSASLDDEPESGLPRRDAEDWYRVAGVKAKGGTA